MHTDINLKSRKKESWRVFDQIAPTYDHINHVISMGVDHFWRRNFRTLLPNKNELVCLDLATGTADVVLELARDARVKHIDGTDMSAGMIELGKQKVVKSEFADKISLSVGDGVHIPAKPSSYDVISVAFGIRNFGDYKTSLQNMVRVLKPGGQAMILEFSLPKNRVFRFIYLFYFRNVLPKIGNALSGHKDAYTYLNRTVEDFPYGDAFCDEMHKAGFGKVSAKVLSFGIATLYIGVKPKK